MVEQSVELQPGESKLVSFEAIPHEEKTYQVSVDGLTGSFRALAPVPVTEILRPNGVGFQTQLTPRGDSPNWKCVDEVTPDEMATCVRSIYSMSADKVGDLYTLTPFPVGPAIINWVQFWIRCHMSGGDYPGVQAALGGVILRTYNKNYYTILRGEAVGWRDLPWKLGKNPYTNQAWTVAELNDFQAGVYLWGRNIYRYCTQVWVEANYTPKAAPVEVSDLVISPTQVNPGQTVTITCRVKNVGNETGTYTITLGGDFIAQQSVTLAPLESKTISFTVIPTEVKTYNISVNGVTGSFVAIPPLPSIDITGFHYVYQAAYTWVLTNEMIHGQDITHIGFRFVNNEAVDIRLSVAFRIENGGTRTLSPPLDQYLNAISQPFTVPPGRKDVWFSFRPSLDHYIATAEVMVNGQSVATATKEFDVIYD